ncbi:unnamed protein product [Owenia fusiformis]|uniref:Hemerythrin-like domain-containing protein n=1 Tax=Owenia fusiformis TaxID=6347 RepID=A0A8S4PQ36_OWEFU|nr:unnamed protein product [Owenia fusiformis]
MGFDIPEPYCWDESFATFYKQIDDEHKGLFQGIFKCAGARSDAGALASLLSVVETHFKNEEKTMEEKNYSDLANHRTIHAKFVADLKALKTPLNDQNVNFAKEWLVNHIKGTDFKYKGKLD